MNPGIDYTGISVSFICHDGSGKFLMVKRSAQCRDERGTWEFGGGKVEFGEDPAVAVLREVKEEYGCDGAIEHMLPLVNLLREHEGRQTHWITIPFIIRVRPDEARINEPEYVDALDWFTLDQLPAPLHRGVTLLLDTHRHLVSNLIAPERSVLV